MLRLLLLWYLSLVLSSSPGDGRTCVRGDVMLQEFSHLSF